MYAFDLTYWMFYFFIWLSDDAADVVVQLPALFEGLFMNYFGTWLYNKVIHAL